MARDSGDGKVYLATHAGLFRYDDAGPVRVGPVIDLMGFTVAGPGRFLASGHPGVGVDLPHPVGLVESTDGGATWQMRSRAGLSDFHALTTSPAGVLGFDGVLRASIDGLTWRELSIPAEPRVLAASPDGTRVLATTAEGVLVSPDFGTTWSAVDGAPRLLLAAWADTSTVVGVGTDGRLHLSRDRGQTWIPRSGRVSDVPQAVSAALHRGRPEVLVVDGQRITRSADLGDSLAPFPTAD